MKQKQTILLMLIFFILPFLLLSSDSSSQPITAPVNKQPVTPQLLQARSQLKGCIDHCLNLTTLDAIKSCIIHCASKKPFDKVKVYGWILGSPSIPHSIVKNLKDKIIKDQRCCLSNTVSAQPKIFMESASASGYKQGGNVYKKENNNNTSFPYVCVQSDDGAYCCTNTQGYYELFVDTGLRTFIYDEHGFQTQTQEIPITGPSELPPIVFDDPQDRIPTTAAEIYGKVVNMIGVSVELYKWECGNYSISKTVKTCADEYYSFGQLSDGTYKVQPVATGCTPTYKEITIQNGIPDPAQPTNFSGCH